MVCPKQEALRARMAKLPITIENGTGFYQHLFTVAPDIRSFFKGSETIEPAAVPSSERFQKQGQRILLAIHTCVNLLHDPMVYRAYAREMVNKHRMFKMEYAHYEAFFPLFRAYLEAKTGGAFNAEETAAWDFLATEFNKYVKEYLDEKK